MVKTILEEQELIIVYSREFVMRNISACIRNVCVRKYVFCLFKQLLSANQNMQTQKGCKLVLCRPHTSIVSADYACLYLISVCVNFKTRLVFAADFEPQYLLKDFADYLFLLISFYFALFIHIYCNTLKLLLINSRKLSFINDIQ